MNGIPWFQSSLNCVMTITLTYCCCSKKLDTYNTFETLLVPLILSLCSQIWWWWVKTNVILSLSISGPTFFFFQNGLYTLMVLCFCLSIKRTEPTEIISMHCPSMCTPQTLTLPFQQDCTNARCQVTVAIKFCMAVPNICGASTWNLLYVTLLMPRILKICAPLPSCILPYKMWLP